MNLRVGTLEVRYDKRTVTIIQSSEDESKPLDLVVVRKPLEAEVLMHVLRQVFTARIWRRIAREELREREAKRKKRPPSA